MYVFYIVAALLFTQITFAAETAEAECQNHSCVAVVDAGSTGSRLHVYAYDTNSVGDKTNVQEILTANVKPGLASFSQHPEELNDYLKRLFQTNMTNIPVYFYGTAGMRLLSFKQQNTLYDYTKKWFAANTSIEIKDIRTITGKEEGIFDWLSVNESINADHANETSSFGAIDIGGASVQIVFPIKNTDGLDPNDVVNVSVHGKSITLFVHSFLGLGQNEALYQFLTDSSCFPKQYTMPDNQAGDGDIAFCEKNIVDYINAVHHVNQKVATVAQKTGLSSWYVLGGIASLANNQPFQFSQNQFDMASLRQEGDNLVCHQNWNDLSGKYSKEDYLYADCFLPAYYSAVIVDGFGLSEQTIMKYLPPEQSPSWTRGVIMANN